MKLKLDENLARREQALFQAAGHDVETVFSQKHVGTRDADLLSSCTAEERTLVTLDTDFTNPLIYPPSSHAGVILIRVGDPIFSEKIRAAILAFLTVAPASIAGELWITQPDRVRKYEEPQA